MSAAAALPASRPAPDAPAVEARDVVKRFGTGDGATLALDGVSLAVRPGEFFTLLGPSGCGKTTLLRLIAGFEYPSAGRILLDGEDIGSLPPYRRPVNTVFQSYALFPHMSVEANVGFGLEMQGRPKGEVRARTGQMLELVRLAEFRRRRTSELSGGQQQRVALARALAPGPRVLLLDEPLSALDYKLRKGMQIELKRMQHDTGITFVFVTHDQDEALSMSDRVAVMSAGRVLQVGDPRTVYERPATRFVADFIGESNLLGASVESTADGVVRVRLDAGTSLSIEAGGGRGGGEGGGEGGGAGAAPHRAGDRCTLVVRPEHASLERALDRADARAPRGHVPDGALDGTLEHAVYSGTDTHRHVRLADGSGFVVRTPNAADDRDRVDEPGTPVRVRIRPGAARPVAD